MKKSLIQIAVVFLSLGVSVASGQDRDRDRDRGRDGRDGRGDRGDGRGERSGFGFGGFGGGPPGSMGGFNPSDFIRRLDTNNNGMIDPDESQGRARFMLERFARDIPGISLDQPIPIDRLTRGMERAREDRERSSSSSGSGSSSNSRSAPVEEPLVPGFGVPDELAVPPGFGTRDGALAVKVNDADLREAEDRLRRYDENRDGFLDRQEISRNRWSDDPFVYDQNRDSRLSAKELAVRYAKRRGGDSNQEASTQNRRSGTSGSSFPFFSQSSTSTSTSNAAPTGDSRTEGIIRFMMDRYDTNKSGVFERDEWSNFRSDPSAADTNKDNKITKEEYTAYMQSRMGGAGGFGGFGGGPPGGGFGGFGGGPGGGFGGPGGFGGFGGPPGGFGSRRDDNDRRDDGDRRGDGDRRDRDGDRRGDDRRDGGSFYSRRSSEGNSSSSNSTAKTSTDRKSYRALTAVERLPKGLPEWFARNDSDGDGQVAMAEFSASWSNSTARDFSQFDLNQDGMITAKECLDATEKGAVRGSSSSSSGMTASSSSRSSSSSRGSSGSSGTPAGSTASTSPAGDSTTSPMTTTAPATQTASATASTPAEAGGADDTPVEPRMLQYAQGAIKKYDSNGDGVLTSNEWTTMSKDPSSADKDGDGKITPHEYARWTASL